MAGYNALFLLICSLDLLFTVYVLEFLNGVELNPILNYYYLQGGIYGLIIVKILFTVKTFFLINRAGSRIAGRPRPRKSFMIACKAAIFFYILTLISANGF